MSVLNNKKLTANQWVKKRDILFANFIGGIAWGLGSVIGATIIVGILVRILTMLGLFDFVKDYFPRNGIGSAQVYKLP
jgi:hypothetical protein